MTRKKSTREPPNEDNLAKALAGFEYGTYSSINAASLATGAPRITLSSRMKGGRTCRETQQLLRIMRICRLLLGYHYVPQSQFLVK